MTFYFLQKAQSSLQKLVGSFIINQSWIYSISPFFLHSNLPHVAIKKAYFFIELLPTTIFPFKNGEDISSLYRELNKNLDATLFASNNLRAVAFNEYSLRASRYLTIAAAQERSYTLFPSLFNPFYMANIDERKGKECWREKGTKEYSV